MPQTDIAPDGAPGKTLRRVHLMIRSNWISSMGASLATLGFLATGTAWLLQSTGSWAGPYAGILGVVVLPAVFVLGLLLVPLGLLVYRKQLVQRLETISKKPLYLARAVVVLTIVNFAGMGTVGYTGAQYMGSVQFCGTACHGAMEPEHTAYLSSPHAHVECVHCHVGPGATSFIKSKINGTKQLLGYVLDDYSKPIPTPVHHLRSARETCENCHWPEKHLGTKLLVRPHYRDDKDVSAYVNVLLMRTGGTQPNGDSEGIHRHSHPDVQIDFVATDDRREQIAWVRIRDRDGSERIYTTEGVDPDHPPEGELRRMDCSDCHNRAAHAFDLPEDAVDRAIAAGLISKRLPFIKKHAVDALHMDWSRADVEDGIRRAMNAAYNSDGLLDSETRPLLEPAIKQLVGIWKRNVYPDRKLHWNSYPDFNSHFGCMRCHEGNHRDRTGVHIRKECDVCHVVLSNEEEDPHILDSLGIRTRH